MEIYRVHVEIQGSQDLSPNPKARFSKNSSVCPTSLMAYLPPGYIVYICWYYPMPGSGWLTARHMVQNSCLPSFRNSEARWISARGSCPSCQRTQCEAKHGEESVFPRSGIQPLRNCSGICICGNRQNFYNDGRVLTSAALCHTCII
jgi:hypothetical protein